jgi:hypothetical protein
MRDGLAAGDRVQLHINNGKKKTYIRNGLDWIKRFPVGRSAAFCPGRVKSPSGSSDESDFVSPRRKHFYQRDRLTFGFACPYRRAIRFDDAD